MLYIFVNVVGGCKSVCMGCEVERRLVIDLFLINFSSSWVGVFKTNPEFRILRLTFQRSQPQKTELGRL